MKKVILFLIVFSLTLFAQWKKIEEIQYPYIYSALFSGDDIYVGGDSLYISRDRGLSWNSVCPTNQPIEITALYKIENVLFLGTYGEGVFLSSDNGENWVQFNSGLGIFANYAKKFISSGDTIFYGTDGGGVYFYKLNTDSWQAYNENLPDNIAWSTNDIVISGNNILLSAGASGFYYIRPKGSSAWIEKRLVSPTGGYTTPNTFLPFNEIVFTGSRAGIFRSYDNGDNFEYVGINALPLNVVSFVDQGNRVYAGLTRANDFFVWYSDDDGSTWNPLYHEFHYLRKLFIYDNKIWAATNDGLYYTELSPSYIEPDLTVNKFTLEQNYPNPFNPGTRISWQSAVSSWLTIKLYDIMGREVETIVNGYYEAGSHSTLYIVNSSLPSGIYYYRLKADNITLTKKMVLLK
uniref:T9SS type A sorting domain-containing protein n=1 Tax=Ignavibacterium album TaxID=591197 RepID=A0A7V2ZMI4_9BACT